MFAKKKHSSLFLSRQWITKKKVFNIRTRFSAPASIPTMDSDPEEDPVRAKDPVMDPLLVPDEDPPLDPVKDPIFEMAFLFCSNFRNRICFCQKKFQNFFKIFVTDFLQPSLIFASKAGAYPSGSPRSVGSCGLYCKYITFIIWRLSWITPVNVS